MKNKDCWSVNNKNYKSLQDVVKNFKKTPLVYKNDKKQGKFQIFDMNFGWATLNYKNGKAIGNPVKMNKKNNLNNHETLQIGFPSPWDKHVISILKNR